ncbi:hypothetical protein FYJ80_09575 [Spirochaetales bacterium NM-380-WT-3C1]|uniref:Uncharacterized protein n=1 Tax=Bullifex porci TaxID=2606638 RepID=A0A7X2PDS5_9SPIO|nr:hypothetical protein [Bullifex porci]MSU07017.1 hypothetical protein [Bullifex porci]
MTRFPWACPWEYVKSSITTGVMLGVVSYVVVMVLRKRAHLIDPVLYIIAAVFVLNATLYTLM